MLLVSGVIGAGKSSLTKELAKEMASIPFYENVDDNEVLPLFYKNPQKYAFLMQIFFLNKRFLAMKNALKGSQNVLDRTIYEDAMILHLNADLGRIKPAEEKQYNKIFNTMLQELEKLVPENTPDLLIFIDVSFETMLERIKKRGRDYEQIEKDASLYDYYRTLHQRYQQWYEAFSLCPKMKIDGDRYDFVEDKKALEVVLRQIKEKTTSLETQRCQPHYQPKSLVEKGIFLTEKSLSSL